MPKNTPNGANIINEIRPYSLLTVPPAIPPRKKPNGHRLPMSKAPQILTPNTSINNSNNNNNYYETIPTKNNSKQTLRTKKNDSINPKKKPIKPINYIGPYSSLIKMNNLINNNVRHNIDINNMQSIIDACHNIKSDMFLNRYIRYIHMLYIKQIIDAPNVNILQSNNQPNDITNTSNVDINLVQINNTKKNKTKYAQEYARKYAKAYNNAIIKLREISNMPNISSTLQHALTIYINKHDHSIAKITSNNSQYNNAQLQFVKKNHEKTKNHLRSGSHPFFNKAQHIYEYNQNSNPNPNPSRALFTIV